ncbi:MAG: IS3 family transposase [Nanoarchaeota archaeon]|nr:IS3 family transposase [Nanoarchaeota archaeon]
MYGDCFFKKSLRETETADCRGKTRKGVFCKMISQKDIPISHGCSSLNIGRGTYYYNLKDKCNDPNSNKTREGILNIALEYPKYGYRRITAELHRQGQPTNHKKVLRIMREENLLCKPKKKFRITTTDSNHNFPTYQNLAKDIALTGINQLWVADITYVHLVHECVYLAVIIDVYSRKCIGWELSRRIDAVLVLNALNMAVDARIESGIAGLIHHSDQGVQYACSEYVNRLKELDIKISMSRRGNPYDNAFAESFMKTLKCEEVYLKEYKTFDEAYSNLKQFIEVVYNNKRLHSSIGYLPPVEFEAKALNISLS